MSVNYRRPKGTYDVLPGGEGAKRDPHERPEMWAWIEAIARETFARYNYSEVRTPVFEEAALYTRSVGESSDIVRKEMFTFTDRGGRELSLRPEGTAGVVRAYVEHSMNRLARPVKLWYTGPMFRYERQQKGRYRQHNQLGAEVLGSDDPLVDVEAIALLYDIHQQVGVRDEVVHINNLGDGETRKRYIPELKDFLEKHREDLDPDSVARLETNPLRTFDSKDENTQSLLKDAPKLSEYLSEDAASHFSQVKGGLDALGIPYVVDELLVRGLDYYTSTVFEAKSSALGAQDTVGAGGRYNNLVQDIGGPDIPGIGFGSGVERILLAASALDIESELDAYFVTLVPEARNIALKLAGELRSAGLACDLDYAGRSAKAQFKQADRLRAKFSVVIGDDELAGNSCKVREMSGGDEVKVSLSGGEVLKVVSG